MRRSAVAVTLAVLSCLVPPPARATQKFGPIQLSGNLQSMNIVRTPDQDTYQFIMNRNVAHIHLDYDWLQSGKFYNKYDIPFIDTSHLSVIWRGVYDSIYDTTPGFIQKEDIHGRAYGNKMTLDEYRKLLRLPRSVLEVSGLSRGERDALKFDNQLREFYIDLKFRNLPLSVRAGRQQIVWGETDNFRMLDRANTLDLTWHFTQEIPGPATYGWDELRRPFWMFKFLYEVGDVWRLSQNFLEWYWNPGDWYPAKQAFLPRPWGLPFLNPLTNPIDGVFIGGVCGASRIHVTSGPNKGLGLCTTLMDSTRLFEQGDYARNPIDNSQVGVRYHALSPFGLEFTLNYMYQRWGGDDGTNYAPLRGLDKTPANSLRTQRLEQAGIFRRVLRPLHPHRRHLGELLGRDFHADRVPLRDGLRLRPPVLRRGEGDHDRPSRAPGHPAKEHVEGHDRLRSPDLDQARQQEEHGLHHRAVLLALPGEQPELQRADRRQPAERREEADRLVPGGRPRPALHSAPR